MPRSIPSPEMRSPPSRSRGKNQPVAPSSQELQPLIRIRDIVKTYKTSAGDFPALKGVSADIYPGQFVSIIGKSGSGKSTLLNMLTGIDRPNSGTIEVGDVHLQNMSESEFSIWRGKNLGIVFQFFQLLPMLSLLENTILPMDFCSMYLPEEREPRAAELLRMVGLEHFLHKPPAAVSSGQEQCAAIARALANDPPIIVADEPTGNLDSKTAELVLQLIDELVARGKTIIVVTHDDSVARRASRILVISDGELVDERISSALPDLSHRSMLLLSHRMKTMEFPAGSELFPSPATRPGFLIVTKGRLLTPDNQKQRVHTFGPGRSLSLFDECLGGDNSNVFQASSHGPLEIKYLDEAELRLCLSEAQDLEGFLKHLPHKTFLSKYTKKEGDNHSDGGKGKNSPSHPRSEEADV